MVLFKCSLQASYSCACIYQTLKVQENQQQRTNFAKFQVMGHPSHILFFPLGVHLTEEWKEANTNLLLTSLRKMAAKLLRCSHTP